MRVRRRVELEPTVLVLTLHVADFFRQFRIHRFSVLPEVNPPVTVRTNRRDPAGVVRSPVCPPADVMGLEIWATLTGAEWGGVRARLADAVGSAQHSTVR